MDKLKYVKLENPDGTYSDSIPLAVDSDHVDVNGDTLTNELGKKASTDLVNTSTTNLQNQINSLASGSPKGVYETTSALVSANPDTGVYVVIADGHIYSWTKNASSAVDLGVYQAVKVEDNSIVYDNLDSKLRNNFEEKYSLQSPTQINGYYNKTSGQFNPSDKVKCSDISVVSGEKYRIVGYSAGNIATYCITDDSTNVLQYNTQSGQSDVIVEMPINAVHLLISQGRQQTPTKVYKLTNIISSINNDDINNNSVSFNTLNSDLSNLIDYNFKNVSLTFQSNSGFYNTNGDIEELAGYSCGYINVNPGEVYSIKGYKYGNVKGYFIYDKFDNLLSYYDINGDFDVTIVIPKNGSKILYNKWDNKDFEINKADLFVNTGNNFTNHLEFVTIRNFEEGYYYDALSGNKSGDGTGRYRCASLDVIAGEQYRVSGYSQSNIRTYTVINSDGEVLLTNPNTNQFTDVIITIPENGSKLLLNELTAVGYQIGLWKQKDSDLKNVLKNITNKTIVFAGDSLTRGSENSNSNVPNFVSNYFPDSEVINRARSGWNTSGLLPELCNMPAKHNSSYEILTPELDYSNCAAVVINMGTNGIAIGSIENSIPDLSKCTDLEDNPLEYLTVEDAKNGGFKYNGELIETEAEYWNLFADDYFGNMALTIEFIQNKNPKTQIFLTPPTLNGRSDSEVNSPRNIEIYMKQLAHEYGVVYIDTINELGITKRNNNLFRYDQLHGTNLRNELFGNYIARQIATKIKM